MTRKKVRRDDQLSACGTQLHYSLSLSLSRARKLPVEGVSDIDQRGEGGPHSH